MTTRSEFLRLVWHEIINAPLRSEWIGNTILTSERDSGAPFADVGAELKRLRMTGASDWDIGLVARLAAYEAVFGVLYKLEDPGIEDATMLFEELLTADPTGLEGRPSGRQA